MAGRSRWNHYRVYGVSVQSAFALPYPQTPHPVRRSDVLIINASEASFRKLTNGASRPTRTWFRHEVLNDGSFYLEWPDFCRFVVSADGNRITCRPNNQASRESVYTYLLGQVLSFALVKKGIEPVHATVVVVKGQAIGFLGPCGNGKSTLAAAFLQAGDRMLTDDLLVVQQRGDALWAYPGPARIKLFPQAARRLLGGECTGVPMNPATHKLVIPLPHRLFQSEPVRLRVLYILEGLGSRRGTIQIRRLSQGRAFVEMLKSAFNNVVVESWRLQQHFNLTALQVTRVPVKQLSYSRTLASLPEVRQAILDDHVATA
jgi:hypothetical protein